jgi:hypothetical protein
MSNSETPHTREAAHGLHVQAPRALRFEDPIRNLSLAIICDLVNPIAGAIALGMTDTELADVLSRNREASEFEAESICQLVSDYRTEITRGNDEWKAND